MSRSFKKNAYIKDNGNGAGKKIGSRKFRRKTKNKLQNHIITEDTLLPEDKSEVINDYDVCDYKYKATAKYGKLKGKNKKLYK